MHTNEIVFIICRLFALYIIFQILSHGTILLSALYLNFDNPIFIIKEHSMIVTAFIMNIILFLFCWIRAKWIASKITNDTKNIKLNISLNKDEIMDIAFQIIGVHLLVKAIPYITKNISLTINIYRDHTHKFNDLLPYYIESSTLLILGLILLLKSQFFVIGINKLRKWQ